LLCIGFWRSLSSDNSSLPSICIGGSLISRYNF
jgi:hypothetical protein